MADSDLTDLSRGRYRRAALSWVSNVAARGVQFVVSLAIVPLALGFLGKEGYGLWMAVMSLVTLLGFADFGVGNGLLTVLSASIGAGDGERARREVSSAFFALLALAAGLGVAFALVYPYVPWWQVFKAPAGPLRAEVASALAVFVALFLAGLPLDVVQRVRMGLQQGYVNGFWSAGGSLLSLAAVLVLVRVRASLPWFVLAVAGSSVVALLGNGSTLFFGKGGWLRPRMKLIDASVGRALLSLGGAFFVVQAASAIAYQSDSIILTQVIGPAAVTAYAVPLRLFLVVPTAVWLGLLALWPAYGEAVARGDSGWAKLALKRSLALSIAVTVPASALLRLAGPAIIRLWVGASVEADPGLLTALAIWMVTNCVGAALTTFLNSRGVVRPQALLSLAMMALNLPLSVVLTRRFGVSGVMWGTVISHFVLILVPFALLTSHEVRRLGSAPAAPPSAAAPDSRMSA